MKTSNIFCKIGNSNKSYASIQSFSGYCHTDTFFILSFLKRLLKSIICFDNYQYMSNLIKNNKIRYFILPILLISFFNNSLKAQSVNFEATTSGQTTSTSLTFSHNRGTNQNTITLVSVQLGRQTTISGNVTYGGNNMTLVGQTSESSGSGLRTTVLIYSIFNAPTGSQNIVVNVSGSNGIVAGATSFSNVNPSAPLRAYSGLNSAATGNYFTANLSNVATGPNEVVFSAISHSWNTTVSNGSGQTQQWQRKAGTAEDQAKGVASTKNIASGTTTSITYGNLADSWWAVGAVSVRPNPCTLSGTLSKTDANCFGNSDGTITVGSPTGGSGSYQYRVNAGSWQSSNSFSGLGAGSYTVFMRDANNTTCEFNLGTLTITQPSALSGSFSKADVLCFGLSTGSITISGSGGTSPYQYRIGSGSYQSSGTFTGLSAGSYSLTVRDANLCTAIVNVIINQPVGPLIGNLSSKTDVLCFGLSTGSTTISGSGGTGPYQYRIGSGSFQTSGTFSGLAAGVHSFTVRDANLCTASLNVTITQPPSVLSLTPTIVQPTCFGSGEISLSAGGGTAPYTFDWADIPGTSNPQNRLGLSPGSYSVVVADANGCTVSSAILNLLSPVGCSPVSVCRSDVNSVFYVTQNPENTSYAWTVPAGAVIVSGQGTPQIVINWNNVAPGVYAICVTGQNNCGNATPICQNVNVTQPEAHATANPVCTGGNLQLFASGGSQYLWSGPSGFTSSGSNPVVLNANSLSHNGFYRVTVTDNSGCKAIDSIGVTVSAGPVITSGVSYTNCSLSTGAVNITVSGGTPGYTYLWNSGATTQNITNVPAGVYTVTVTDNAGCTSFRSSSVGTIPGPTVTVAATNVNCNGANNGSINLTLSGGSAPFSFLWSNGATTQNLTSLSVGNYSVVVNDQAGCQSAAFASITQPAAITTDFTQQNVKCFGASTGSIDLIVSGGTSPYNYSWTKNNVSYGGNTQDLSGLGAGVYRVTVTDGNSCVSTNLISITQPGAAITATSVVTPVACNGQQNGGIVLSASGGTAPYSFNWSGPSGFSATTKDISNLFSGTYNVTVTDQNACTSVLSGISVTSPGVLTISPVVAQMVSCSNGSDGVIDISVSGGNTPYSYLWSNGATTQDISSLNSGTYQVVVTDNKGCTATVSRIISQPSVLSTSSVLTHVACFGNATGAIDVSVSGGTSPYSYQWSDGSFTGQDRSNIGSGLYVVTVTDSKSCKITLQNVINQNAAIMVSGLVTNPLCQGNTTGAIQLNVSGGSGTYTYSWSNGLPPVQNPSGLSAGSYIVTVTDQVGCTKTQNFTITQPSVISLTHTSTNVSCNGQANGSIQVVATGGTPPYLYSWSNGENAASIQNLIPDIYTVTVTDANSCVQQRAVTVSQPTQLNITGTSIPNCPQQNNGNITLNVNGATSPYTYTWNDIGSGSGVRSGLGSGMYSVTVTDALGCKGELFFELNALEVIIGGRDRTCFGNDGLATVSATGGALPYSFLWNNGMTTEEISGLAAGTYTVTVTSGSCIATQSVTVGSPIGCLPPLAVDDYFTIVANTTLTNTVMPPNPTDPGYDSDPVFALSALQFENLTPIDPVAGYIAWEENGGFTYTPATNYIGSFSLDYRICNPSGLCDEATIYIEVIPDCDALAPVISEY